MCLFPAAFVFTLCRFVYWTELFSLEFVPYLDHFNIWAMCSCAALTQQTDTLTGFKAVTRSCATEGCQHRGQFTLNLHPDNLISWTCSDPPLTNIQVYWIGLYWMGQLSDWKYLPVNHSFYTNSGLLITYQNWNCCMQFWIINDSKKWNIMLTMILICKCIFTVVKIWSQVA